MPSPHLSAQENMALDEELLLSLANDPTCRLRFHRWQSPSATYGYFTAPEKFLALEGVQRFGMDLARRPTGGGILFHTHDLSFAVVVPVNHPRFSLNTLDNYALINGAVLKAVQQLLQKEKLQLLPCEGVAQDETCRHFCMAKPTQYDVMMEGRKIAGGAQRRTNHGFLHQGSLSLQLPPMDFLQTLLLPGTCVVNEMQRQTFTFPLRCEQKLEKLLTSALQEALNP